MRKSRIRRATWAGSQETEITGASFSRATRTAPLRVSRRQTRCASPRRGTSAPGSKSTRAGPQLGRGQDEQGGGRQGDAVGNAGLGVVQMQGERHAGDPTGERVRPREQDTQGQGSPEDRRDEEVVAEAVEAEPQGRGGR